MELTLPGRFLKLFAKVVYHPVDKQNGHHHADEYVCEDEYPFGALIKHMTSSLWILKMRGGMK